MRHFFEGIHWLLTWMVIYIALNVFVVSKHDGLYNLGAMGIAFVVTVAAMWIRSEL